MTLDIDPDIRRARLPPGSFYRDPAIYQTLREEVFPRTWHLLDLPSPTSQGATPGTLLPDCLDEPLLLSRDAQGQHRALSNVCTHRGNLLLDTPSTSSRLRCGYHGRCFDLRGQVCSAPGFRSEDLRAEDDLPDASLARWGPLWFASLDPHVDSRDWLSPLERRLGHLPLEALRPLEPACRDFEVEANWALYCDNYLEGFHVPFVHPGLVQALDVPHYAIETSDWGSLQVGAGAPDTPCLPVPEDHPDHGRGIAAWYFWLFPCTMINVYPWGLSVNAVQPMGPQRTRIVFRGWTWQTQPDLAGAGADLFQVELEDEAVVSRVQSGTTARLSGRGIYAPEHEVAVHHFHRLLARLTQS